MTAAASDAPLWAPPPRPTAVIDPVLDQAPRLKALQTAADPRALSAALMVGLVLVVGFRHPVTRAIGTAGSEPPTLAQTPATKTAAPSTVPVPRAVPDTTPAIKLHAPRDPFAPLTQPTTSAPVAGGVQAAAATGISSDPTPSSTPATSTTSSAPTAAATAYRVRPGDSLWNVARRTMSGRKTVAAVATAWRQIYADNRAVIGTDPGVLQVGVVLSLRAPKH